MIYLGTDHGGYELKEQVKTWLDEWGLAYEDLGAHEYDGEDDFPQYAFAVAEKVAQSPDEHMGILACRSGGGMIIAANKVKGIRALDVQNEESAKHARDNNNANVVSLAGDWLSLDEARAVLEVVLNTEFSDKPRYQRRNDQISEYEANH